MYFVYRFLDNSENVIYVGKSKQALSIRFASHSHLPENCYKLVRKIEYIECPTEADMSIKEIFYINKYKNNSVFFNVLDVTEQATSISFDDIWILYDDILPDHSSNSINKELNFAKKKEVRYTKNGEVDRRKCNRRKGISTFVDGLTNEEVDLIVDYFMNKFSSAVGQMNKQLCLRNLLLFVLGVNLPIKANDLLQLKYKDIFNQNDIPQSYKMQLGRFGKDEVLLIPLKKVVEELLIKYSTYANLTYLNNAEDYLFVSRQSEVLTRAMLWLIFKKAIEGTGIDKNIGVESIRKTYFLNVYNLATNKLNAIRFLGELQGRDSASNIINYLNLDNESIDYDYYFGEDFSLCNIDFSTIDFSLQHKTHEPSKKKSNIRKPVKKPDKKALDNDDRIIATEDICLNKTSIPSSYKTNSNSIKKTRKEDLLKLYSLSTISLDEFSNACGIKRSQILKWIYEEEHKLDKKSLISNHGPITWTKGMKVEVIKQFLSSSITLNELSIRYNVNTTLLNMWLSEYKEFVQNMIEEETNKRNNCSV